MVNVVLTFIEIIRQVILSNSRAISILCLYHFQKCTYSHVILSDSVL